MADIPLDNIGGEACEPISGLATDVFIIERKDLATMVDPKDLCGDAPDAAATLAELAEIPTPGHTLEAGKHWWKFPFIQESGTVTSTQIGEKKRRLIQNQITGQVAGSAPTLLGFMRWVKNKDLVVLVREVGSGNMRQLGSNLISAWAETQEHLIEGPMEGQNALNITFMDKQKWAAPIYKGEVVTEVAGG